MLSHSEARSDEESRRFRLNRHSTGSLDSSLPLVAQNDSLVENAGIAQEDVILNEA